MTTAADLLWRASQSLGIGADPNAITRQYGPSGWGISMMDGGYDWCAVSTYVWARLAGNGGLVSASPFVSGHISFHLNQGTWLGSTRSPRPGDEIVFDWEVDGSPDHIGVVEAVGNGLVYTIEGNSGDQCRRRSYSLADSRILGYGRPRYTDTSANSEQEDDMALYVRPDGNSTTLIEGKARIWSGDNRTLHGTVYSGTWELTSPGARRLTMAEWAAVQAAHAAAGRKVPVGEITGNQLETIIYVPELLA